MKILIDGATASDATKQVFILGLRHFTNNSVPAIKTAGLGTGDSVIIYESVNDVWQAAQTLDESTTSTIIRSVGKYAVDITMATAGPASVGLDASYE